MKITVTYAAVDGFRRTRTFKTLDYARKFAQRWVGEHPCTGVWYAISDDGVGRITVEGDATLNDLFPPAPSPYRPPAPVGMYYDPDDDQYHYQPNEGGYIAMQGDPWAGYDEPGEEER